MLVIGAGVDLRIRMQPGGHVIAGWMEECAKFHHLVGAFGAHRHASKSWSSAGGAMRNSG